MINDREVSRHHLRFTKGADGFTLEDLGSTNGTFVNGKRVTGAIALKNGDMVGLGETVTLQYETGRPGAAVPPPAQQQQQPASPTPAPQPRDGDAAYRPPAQQQQPAPAQPQAPSPPPQQPVPQSDPYSQGQAAPQQQYAPQQDAQPQYQQADAYAPPQDYYGNQQGQAAAYGPPPPGYDYDPYAMRDDEGSSTTQWLLIGCLGLLLLCCCLTVVVAVAVDQFCLYESIPVLRDVLNALGVAINCPA